MKMGDNIPNEIVIELTNKCNLDCEFCFNRQEGKDASEPPKEDVFGVLEDAANSGIGAVRVTGGEPLLREDVLDILRKAKSLGLYVILNTNAFLIDEKNKEALNYVDLALFSLHSPARVEKIREKLALLKSKDIKIMLATIATRPNIKNLEQYYGFVSNIKQENLVEWFLLRPLPNKFEKKPISKQDIKELYKKMLGHNKKYNLDIKIANALPFCAIEENLALVCNGGSFDSGYTRLVVGCDGNYRADYFSSTLGNIKDSKIMDIWNSDKLKDIRKHKNAKEECKKCHYLKKCKGGLIGREYLYGFDNVACLASVIVPAFNDSERLSLLIKSLENQTCSNFEVIVVDDGSTDNTKQAVEELKKELKTPIRYFYLDNTDIFGAGIARNFGAKQAKGRILIFLDQDNVANPKLIDNHLEEHEKNDIVLGYYAGYGNKKYRYVFKKLKENIEKNRAIKTVIPEFRREIFKNPKKYTGQEWKYFVSANFSIKKKLFLKYLFDENLQQWGAEDIDLGYRLIKGGHPLIFSSACMTYNSSDKKMLNRDKFTSLMRILIKVYKKHKTEELKRYCFERFYRAPIELKSNARLLEVKNRLVFREETAPDKSNDSRKITGNNLLVIIPKLSNLGGAEKVIIHAMEVMHKRGHKITLITETLPEKTTTKKLYGIDTDEIIDKFYLIKTSKLSNLFYDLKVFQTKEAVGDIEKIIEKEKPDMLFVSQANLPEIKTNIPKIAFVWCPFKRTLGDELLPKQRRISAKQMGNYVKESPEEYIILSNSEWTSKKIKEVWNCESKVLYPPCDINKGGVQPKEKKRKICTLSRFNEHKHLENAIGAQKMLPDFELHFIGIAKTKADKNYLKYLKRIANKKCFFHVDASLEQKKQVLKQSKYALQLSGLNTPDSKFYMNYEHFGISVAEMLSYGCILQHYKLGFFPEFILDDKQKFSNIQGAVNNIKYFETDKEAYTKTLVTNQRLSKKYTNGEFERNLRKIIGGLNLE